MPHTDPTPALAPSVASLRHLAMDFLGGLVLFALIAGGLSVAPGYAFPAPPPPEVMSGLGTAALAGTVKLVPVAMTGGETVMMAASTPFNVTVLVAFAFASLIAFNMSIVRHLRRAYASPRR